MDRGVLIYQNRRPDGIEMHGDWGSACISVMIRETHKDYFEVFGRGEERPLGSGTECDIIFYLRLGSVRLGS